MHMEKAGRARRWGAAMAALLFAGVAGSAPPVASPVTSEAVAGASLSEWTARWWRWADAQRVPPYLDPDGRLCGLGQEGPVWYLAGTNGRFAPNRECDVPEGKHLLLPIINMAYYQGDPDLPCAQMQAGAAVNNEHLLSAVVVLDGQLLGDMRVHRVKSPGCFRMDPDDDTSRLAAADGYWLMIKPLSRGRHTIRVGANYGALGDEAYGHMQQSFEYVLHVGTRTQVTQAGPLPGAVAAR